MKRFSLFFGFLLVTTALHADDFKTRDGKEEFKGATVTRVEWDGITVTTDSGIEKIPFDNLPDEIRAKYHLTAEKHAQFQQAVRDAAAKQAQADSSPGPETPAAWAAAFAAGWTEATTKAEATPTPDTRPPISLTAEQLAKEVANAYGDNQIAAASKYENRHVIISGVISQIAGNDAPYILLDGGIVCKFPAEAKEALAALSKGSSVVIEGTFKDVSWLITIDDCRLR